VLRALLKLGGRVETVVDLDYTLLFYAVAINQDAALVSVLLDARANPNQERKQQMLGTFGVGPGNPSPKPSEYISTPLISAAQNGKARIVELLLKAGANSTYKDSLGKTAFDYAHEKKNVEVLGLLRKISVK
jgi:ankyrin repeat protein